MSSAETPDDGVDEGPRTSRSPASHGRSAPRAAGLGVVLWLIICVVLGVLAGTRDFAVSGNVDGLIPLEHRAPSGRALAMLWRNGEEETSGQDLFNAADQIHEVVGDRWTPLAAPSAEISGWLDAHALYLWPVAEHDVLASRLSDQSISAAVADVKGRLSSPFFALGPHDARRDPLGLAAATASASAQERAQRDPSAGWDANVTVQGDLVTLDGTALLMMVDDDRSVPALNEELRAQLQPGLSAEIVGPVGRRDAAAQAVRASLGRLLAVALAAITIVLAAAMRRVGRALAVLACLGSALLAALLWMPLDPLSVPMLVLLVGFGCQVDFRGGRRGDLIAAGVLMTSLAPLWLTDYPLWQSWSWRWAAAAGFVAVALRLVLPRLLAVMRADGGSAQTGFALRPMPLVGLVVAVASLGAGGWALTEVRTRGADAVDVGTDSTAPSLEDTFFDPNAVARVRTDAEDVETAFSRAAIDARLLLELVPTELDMVDSPGRIVLPRAELDRRQVGLRELDLPARLSHLGESLENGGFRPAAFGEFLRGASDPDQAPTVGAALDSPLGRWMRRYVDESETAATVFHEVHLPGNPSAVPPDIETPDGRRLDLRGPAIAARLDLRNLLRTLGMIAMSQIWLGALMVWLVTRSLRTALAAALASLCTYAALLAGLAAIGLPLSPILFPAFLLAGSSAVLASARACRSVEERTPLLGMGLLVTATCPAAAAAALITSSIPTWSDVGVVAALGAVVAVGLGLFVAPGLANGLQRRTDEEVPS